MSCIINELKFTHLFHSPFLCIYFNEDDYFIGSHVSITTVGHIKMYEQTSYKFTFIINTFFYI